MNRLSEFYQGKKVLITGHTGFKGVWLSAWLKHLGAEVIGFALEPPSRPNSFETCNLQDRVTHIKGDVCELEQVTKVFEQHCPDVVFHLAAQSLVRLSFKEPIDTFNVNVMGTVHVLETARQCKSVQSVISVTSDKCYRNQNWIWGYRETDELGGVDPYSSSKACAELVVSCLSDKRYQKSARATGTAPIASVRAGNVIGGGDWASDRIIPDIIRAIEDGRDVVIRSPKATRPWQHVLEPLSGYLWLAIKLAGDRDKFTGGWNFGPKKEDSWMVQRIVEGILQRWKPSSTSLKIEEDSSGAESQLLRLDCVKAQELLGWQAIWNVPDVLDAIVDWYQRYFDNPGSDMYPVLIEQIERFSSDAQSMGQTWAQEKKESSQ